MFRIQNYTQIFPFDTFCQEKTRRTNFLSSCVSCSVTKISMYFLGIPFFASNRLYCFEKYSIIISLMKNKTLKPNIYQKTHFCQKRLYSEEPFNYLRARPSTFQLGGWHGRANVIQFITTTVLGPTIRRRQRELCLGRVCKIRTFGRRGWNRSSKRENLANDRYFGKWLIARLFPNSVRSLFKNATLYNVERRRTRFGTPTRDRSFIFASPGNNTLFGNIRLWLL